MKVRIFSYNYTSLVYFNPCPVIIALHYDAYIENEKTKQNKTWEFEAFEIELARNVIHSVISLYQFLTAK